MKVLLIALLSFVGFRTYSQQNISGVVADQNNAPLAFVSVAFLDPADSSFVYFALSDDHGYFVAKNVALGDYLIQTALMGYETNYLSLHVPAENNGNVGIIVLKDKSIQLGTVNIEAERIPILFNGDTIEYNADSFKTKPDASAEDLLKKLPGVEVDEQGNIKAQGENVQKVLVDGKEFFSSDPTVATKNLPADAVKKVQVFEGKGTESELTGIDDGTREKTINLQLKDDKKNAWFGDLMAGGGTDEHFKSNAKLYRFSPTQQFAVLGMYNNINQFGFSVNDYIDFSGGISSLMSGEGLSFDSDLPVNFGQQVTGLNTSLAAGINYTYEPTKNRRYNLSYMGNGKDTELTENSITQNFIENSTFDENRDYLSDDRNQNHRVSTNIRHRIDSTQNLLFTGNFGMSSARSSALDETKVVGENSSTYLRQNQKSKQNNLSGKGRLSYLKKFDSSWDLFKVTLSTTLSSEESERDFENESGSDTLAIADYFQNNSFLQSQHQLSTSISRRLSELWRTEIGVDVATSKYDLTRTQGTTDGQGENNFSEQLPFVVIYDKLNPTITFRYKKDKKNLGITLGVENGRLENSGLGIKTTSNNYLFVLPSLWYENSYNKGRRVNVEYSSSVQTPQSSQLFPYADPSNPLNSVVGNANLRPEQMHYLRLGWNIFDQFSFTSFFVNLGGRYTHDKINLSRNIDENLIQQLTYINVEDDYNTEVSIDFKTPIRKLTVNFSLEASSSYDIGFNVVNDRRNQYNSFNQRYEVSFENRNKEKVNAEIGSGISQTQTTNSLFDGTTKYYNYFYFASLSYQPTDKWSLSIEGKLNNYVSTGFSAGISVPMVEASLSRYFAKNNRCSLTISVYDALNQNTGIQRTSEYNFVQETRSNIIQQYYMLTFKYRISKFEGGSGIQVEVN